MSRVQAPSFISRRRGAFVAAFALVMALQASGASAQGAAVLIEGAFANPIYAAAPAGDPRLFIVERDGTIRVLTDGAVLDTPFLDIRDAVANPSGSEGGLLGLAFASDYEQSGVFYVYYTGDVDPSGGVTLESRVSRFTVSPTTPNVANSQETVLFRLEQPYTNHNGGTIAIRDGFLYLGLGDGGSAGDPEDRAQNDSSPFGKMLRFDLSQQQVPWTPETWAKGLRNPFRFSFDRGTGDLYIGDVGQNNLEEIDAEPADSSTGGRNYGWDVKEGTNCFDPDPGEPSCTDPSLVPPIHEFDHGDGNCAVTGGTVYRGNASPSLRGLYFFSDYCSARIWTLRWNRTTGIAEEFTDRTSEFPPSSGGPTILQPVAITEDGHGELILVSLLGNVYRLVPEPGTDMLGAAAFAALASLARRERLAGTNARSASRSDSKQKRVDF
jgi:glucose/arabinose dehydrogenase